MSDNKAGAAAGLAAAGAAAGGAGFLTATLPVWGVIAIGAGCLGLGYGIKEFLVHGKKDGDKAEADKADSGKTDSGKNGKS